MTLIDHQRLIPTSGTCVSEGICLLWFPDLSAEYPCLAILYYSSRPCWYTLATPMAPVDKETIEIPMMERITCDLNLPVTIVVDSLELPYRHRLPVIK